MFGVPSALSRTGGARASRAKYGYPFRIPPKGSYKYLRRYGGYFAMNEYTAWLSSKNIGFDCEAFSCYADNGWQTGM